MLRCNNAKCCNAAMRFMQCHTICHYIYNCCPLDALSVWQPTTVNLGY